jgi:hypothetical protein
MRARNIKPDFFRDAELAEVSIEARYLFIGLWCLADRQGKLKDKPKQIRFEVFPETKTKDDINTLLNSLQDHNLIIRYESEKVKYIKVINFLKHQSPHHTEMQSKYPDPPCVTVSYGEPPEISSDIPLIPDSLIPEYNPPSPLKGGGNGIDQDFETWWKAYPGRRKQGKPVCLAKWKHLRKTGTLPPLSEMLSTLEAQKQSLDWVKDAGEFIPGPLPYLNQSKFFDESVQSGSPPAPSSRDPACPRCQGSGLFPGGKMPDGSPAMRPCDCEAKDGARA